ncbi:MAG: protein-L-isoaspartate(D-aspartate) O-methyltransferase [Spirochaetales bacterium]|nr:protein-L-isoaspartate(D-aspartate) O-methyltransferase [Spirochaetales bacterium]
MDYPRYAEIMIQEQLLSRDITDTRVLRAMKEIPRHSFVPSASLRQAYGDFPLPIGSGQTISQPYMVAYMTQVLSLEGSEKVMEIGTGSGYQTAILSLLAREVYTLEILASLAEKAKKTIQALGLKNIHYRIGDGYQGWVDEAPFDGIIVTAACTEIPPPLVQQLHTGAVMVLPLGRPSDIQELVIVRKEPEGASVKKLMDVRFVPLRRKSSKM